MFKEYEMKGDIVTCRLYVKVRIAHWNNATEDYDPDLRERLGAEFLCNTKDHFYVFKRYRMSDCVFRSEVMDFMRFFDSPHWKDTVLHFMERTKDGCLFASQDFE